MSSIGERKKYAIGIHKAVKIEKRQTIRQAPMSILNDSFVDLVVTMANS